MVHPAPLCCRPFAALSQLPHINTDFTNRCGLKMSHQRKRMILAENRQERVKD